MVDVQRHLEVEREAGCDSNGATNEVVAPNGRIAVLVSSLWVGYRVEDSVTGRGTSRTIALFQHVIVDGQVRATWMRDCTSTEKRPISKQMHHDRCIRQFRAPMGDGGYCLLFTL
jgi:hypothetical protein